MIISKDCISLFASWLQLIGRWYNKWGSHIQLIKLQTVGEQNFLPLGWWGSLGAQRRAVWGGCERKVSWAEQWVGVWVEPSSPVQSAALTEPSLWPFSRGSWWDWGGQAAGGLSAHWALLCAQKLPAYGRSIKSHQRKRKKTCTENKVLEKYLTLSGISFFRLKHASRHCWFVMLWNVCHPVSLTVFMMNQRWWLIHQFPSAASHILT